MTQEALNFDGATAVAELDQKRLAELWRKVKALMIDGHWRTLEEISNAIGAKSESSVSARLRDLRKERFGGHTVNRRRRGEASSGLFEYQVIVK